MLSWGKASQILSNDLTIVVGLERIRYFPGSHWNIHEPSCLTQVPSVYDDVFFATVPLDVQRAVEESNPVADHQVVVQYIKIFSVLLYGGLASKDSI